MTTNGNCPGPLLRRVGGGPVRPLKSSRAIRLAAGEAIRFDLASGGHWYGHGFAHVQPYPLNTGSIAADAFAVNNIQSPIWMCSAGYAILAETNAVLSVRLNADGDGCLAVGCPEAPLTVRVFRGADLPSAHRMLMAHLGWPNRPPHDSFLGDVVFCTWTQYPRRITAERVMAMARAIREQDYPCSTITIDDRWESAYGELRFSGDFPDPAGMVRELHALGFRVLLWVTPFVNREAATFADLAERGLLVPRRDGAGAALLRWWGGEAGLIDLTNPAGRDWYRRQVMRLKDDVGVDGFKIDGGDAKYQPAPAESAWHDGPGASGYADALLAVFEEVAPGCCESRTAWLSQRRDVLWRQGGKDSHWRVNNGLAAVVTLGLHMALMGYDVFMPDMIPGRVQTLVADTPLPTDDLLVRWTEVSAFMPVMQFSYFPWNYAARTASVVRAYACVHQALGAALRGLAADRRAPLLRPLWYDHPGLEALWTVADQFMLGPDLVVAPVLAAGRRARDVILPAGSWRDAWTGDVYREGVLVRHPAPCPGMPVFVRAVNEDLFAVVHRELARIPSGVIRPGLTSATQVAGVDRDLTGAG